MEHSDLAKSIREKVNNDLYGRKALSYQYPVLVPFVLGVRRFVNNFRNGARRNLSRKKSTTFFDSVVARHSSPLFRKLGESDPHLQIAKVTNLKVAIDALQGTIILPGEIFSFWNIIGAPSKKRGYVKGMLLSRGKVVPGIGGGLCQLSNLLYWLFLHAPVEIVERQHHSKDVFPDSGRSIPFGSGATVFYNLIDLKIKNTSKYPIQLKLWLTDTQLKGHILSTYATERKYHVFEKNHYFVQTKNGVYRYNEIWREALVEGVVVSEEKIITNCAPIMYSAPRIDFALT